MSGPHRWSESHIPLAFPGACVCAIASDSLLSYLTLCNPVDYIAGEGNSSPLQYSRLENPMDGGAWWATVHRVVKSWTQLTSLSLFTFMHWRRKWQPTPVFLPGESQGREPDRLLSIGQSGTTDMTWQQQQGYTAHQGLPGSTRGKEPTCQCRRQKSHGFDPWVKKTPWCRKWATRSSVLAWEIPWTEEPGGLQSMGSQRVGHD